MTMTIDTRAKAVEQGRASLAGQSRMQSFEGHLRAQRSTGEDGKTYAHLEGYASVVDTPYTMWDIFGEYEEVVTSAAFDVTLAKKPNVNFLMNHAGTPLASTKAGTLKLSVDDTGLLSQATLNTARSDSNDLVIAVEDGDVNEMSFAFRIVSGRWSDDFMTYYISEVDLERGDVSAVTFGANPFTSIQARAQQAFEAVEFLEGVPLDALITRAEARRAALSPEVEAETPAPKGQDGDTVLALIEAGLL